MSGMSSDIVLDVAANCRGKIAELYRLSRRSDPDYRGFRFEIVAEIYRPGSLKPVSRRCEMLMPERPPVRAWTRAYSLAASTVTAPSAV